MNHYPITSFAPALPNTEFVCIRKDSYRQLLSERYMTAFNLGIFNDANWSDGGKFDPLVLRTELGLEPGWHPKNTITQLIAEKINYLVLQNEWASTQLSMRPMTTAKRDPKKLILVKFRDDLKSIDDQSSPSPWAGRFVVLRHEGFTISGFDMGWSVAAPVGRGGLPESDMEGWWPLPGDTD